MESVLAKVGAFIVIICAGYLAGHTGAISRDTSQVISKIVFNFTLPCSVVNAFGQAEFSSDLLWLIPVGIAFTVVSYLVMLPFALRLPSRADRVFYLCNISGYNIGCFTLPFVQAFFPAEQAVAICLFDAGNALMMSGGTYALTSVLVPNDGERIKHPVALVAKRLFSSLSIDAYIVLVALALAGIRVPEALISFTQPMANANAFLALFMLGLMTRLRIDTTQLGKVGRLLTLRGLLNVIFSLLALFVLPFGQEVRTILLMGVWAPVGVMGPVFTQWCGGDGALAGFANAITVAVAIMAMTTVVLVSGAGV